VGEGEGYRDRADETGDGTFPRFLGAEMWREKMFADGASCKVRDRVASPDNHEHEEEQARAFPAERVQANGVGERKSYQQQAAGADTCRGQSFDDGAASGERDEFIKRRATWGGDIRVVDVELGGLSMPDSSHAVFQVDYAWMRMNEDTLRSTRVAQKWSSTKGGWALDSDWALVGVLGIEFAIGLIVYRIATDSAVERGMRDRERILDILAKSSSPVGE